MLKISRDSWHFRINDRFYDTPEPSNLCPYMRRLVWALFCYSLLALLAFSVVVGAVSIVLYLTDTLLGLWPTLTGPLELYVRCCGITVAFVSVIIGIATIFYSIFRGVTKLKYLWWNYLDRQDPTTESQPNVVWEFIKAKHQKVCPQLTFG